MTNTQVFRSGNLFLVGEVIIPQKAVDEILEITEGLAHFVLDTKSKLWSLVTSDPFVDSNELTIGIAVKDFKDIEETQIDPWTNCLALRTLQMCSLEFESPTRYNKIRSELVETNWSKAVDLTPHLKEWRESDALAKELNDNVDIVAFNRGMYSTPTETSHC